jgi:hypothetical protein
MTKPPTADNPPATPGDPHNMNNHPRDTPAVPLTDSQHSRIDYARRDLTQARAEDLAALEPARLILLVEMLRRRLDDVLQVVDEITEPRNDMHP